MKAVGQPMDGSRVRVSVAQMAPGSAIDYPPVFLAVGESTVFEYTAGDQYGTEELMFNAPNSSSHSISVQPFALRAPRKRFQVERRKTITVPLSISVAAGVDPSLVARLVASPPNPNVTVPGYDPYMGNGKWNVEM